MSFPLEQLPAVVPYFCQPPRRRCFSKDFTTNLNPECWAFSRALKIDKLKAPLLPSPIEAIDTIDWFMTPIIYLFFFANVQSFYPTELGLYLSFLSLLTGLQVIKSKYYNGTVPFYVWPAQHVSDYSFT